MIMNISGVVRRNVCFLIVIIRKLLPSRRIQVIFPVHPVSVIIAVAAIVHVRDRARQALVVLQALWDQWGQEDVLV